MSVYADKPTLDHETQLTYAAEFEHNGHTVKFVKGETYQNRGFAIRAANGTRWWRHDRVEINGRLLEGTIQVRNRGGRIDSLTGVNGGCVVGSDWIWLARQNGIDPGRPPAVSREDQANTLGPGD